MKTYPYPESIKVLSPGYRKGIGLMGLCLLFLLSACQQLSDSFEETRHPRPDTTGKRPAGQQSGTSTHTSSTYTTTSATSTVIVSDTVKTPGPGFFETSAAGWDSIQQQLHNLPGLKGQKLFLYKGFFLYDYQGGMIRIELQDPANRANVDVYRYHNGAWAKEEPVKITGNIPMAEELMPLGEVKFNAIAKIWDIASKKASGIKDAASITHIYFDYLKRTGTKEWYLSIRSPRHDYYLKFDVRGNLVNVR